jgi:hypothetical protein
MMETTRMIQFGLSRLSCAMEARDITGAKAFVSNDFEMVFPGARRPESLADLAHNSRRRFRHVTAAIEGFDVGPATAKPLCIAMGRCMANGPMGARGILTGLPWWMEKLRRNVCGTTAPKDGNQKHDVYVAR